MRKLGIITDIETNNITIASIDAKTEEVTSIQTSNFDKTTEFQLLQIVEYQESNNQITPLDNVDYSRQENKNLLIIFGKIITKPHLTKVFLEQLDELEAKPKKKK